MREWRVVGKVEKRALGLDTLAEAMDRARRGEISSTLCVACAENLVEVGFKFYAVDTTSRGIQTEIGKQLHQNLSRTLLIHKNQQPR